MYTFSFAELDDTDALMLFMKDHWNANHILSKNKELFLFDFQDGNKLNIGIAKDEKDNIAGIFGFMNYNSRSIPDIAGSLWKVIENPKIPMLGLKLRKFVVENIKHRFFAAPGAGLQTKPIYRMLNMNWHRMEQYFILNPKVEEFKIALIPNSFKPLKMLIEEYECILKISDTNELNKFSFEAFEHILPYKDFDYLKNRYFENPFRQYEVYGAYSESGNIESIMVFRIADCEFGKVCRVVDFIGAEKNMTYFAAFLKNFIIQNNLEYVDFIAHGFNLDVMNMAGFNSLEFSSNAIIIPNYFEPFERKNVPVYCVSDQTELTFRQTKADGDQDRPNFI